MSIESTEPARVRLLVSGRVQGVCFRAYTVEEARDLELSGWVRNLADGRVEIEAQGPREDVERLVAWANRGSPYATVTGVASEWIAAVSGGESGFRVRR